MTAAEILVWPQCILNAVLEVYFQNNVTELIGKQLILQEGLESLQMWIAYICQIKIRKLIRLLVHKAFENKF